MSAAASHRGHQLGLSAQLTAALVAVLLMLLTGCASDGGGGGGQVGTGTIVGSLEPGSVKPQFVKWVNKAGHLCPQISPPLIAAQLDQESDWDPKARSGAGAEGIAQWMPGSWASWKVDANGNGTASPWEAPDAIVAQGKYMCSLADQATRGTASQVVSGTLIELALAGYNAGWGAVERAGGIPNNAQTQHYVVQIPKLAISRYGGSWSQPAGTGPSGVHGPAKVVLAAMESKIGTPYVWGGGTLTGPGPGNCSGVQPDACHMSGFDCSGYTRFGLYQVGLTVPRTASQQQKYLRAYNVPTFHGSSSLKPGDVLFEGSPATHVAIYYGGGKIIEEPHPGLAARVTGLYFTPSTVARPPYDHMAKTQR